MTDSEFLETMFADIEAEQGSADWGPGCVHCDADVSVTVNPADPLVLHVWISHDIGCPLCPPAELDSQN